MSTTITVRPSQARGHADHGWLDSHHTFSFADYHDPKHMGFRSLRVINEDRVAAGMGFPTHPHRDMEIFSYVLDGALAHKDSLGNGRVLLPGQIQLMGAGTGVRHSEFNHLPDSPAHFLQIWIMPSQRGLAPSYTEWHPKPGVEASGKVLVISPEGRADSAVIRQDADIWRVRLASGESVSHELRAGRGAWVQVMRGSLTLNGLKLGQGDGASTETAGILDLATTEGTEALLFDLA